MNKNKVGSKNFYEVLNEKEEGGIKHELREEELKEADLTRKVLFKKVREAMEAEEVGYDEKGEEIYREPDHKTRLMAAKEARELLGETRKGEEEKQRIPNIVLIIPRG